MKKIMLIIVALVLISGAYALRPQVWVSSFNATPEVGRDFNLTIEFINQQPKTCANNILLSVEAGYPFIMKGISTVPVGNICGNQRLTAMVPLRVDPTATGGSYQVTINTNYETTTLAQYSSSSILNLFVEGAPQITAWIVGSDPLNIYPGDTAILTVDVQNEGTFQAQSVSAEMSAPEPLDIIWSKSSDSLGLLKANQAQTANFAVEVPKNAPSGIYKLQLDVTYRNQDLGQVSRTFTFNMVVKEKALFTAFSNDSVTLYRNQNSRKVDFILKNTGTDKAERLKVRMLPTYPFTTDGSVHYIETLAPGETKGFSFSVNTDKDATPGTYGLDLLVDFEDTMGRSFQDTTEVSLTIVKEGILRRVFVNYWYFWTILAAVIILSRILNRKKRK